MGKAIKVAGLRGLRTTIQALAGVAATVPVVSSFTEAKTAGLVAAWASVGAFVAGVAAFLQNYSEELEALED